MIMMRILLVDDHIIFRKGVAALLSNREDMTIVGEAGNGLEAIQTARELLPEVILMDINMPQCNGLEATRRIKQIRPELPIVATTANTYDENYIACREAGCDGFLTKPLQFRKMFELMQSFFDMQA